MWKKLLVASIVVLILSIGISQAYYNSLYDNKMIINIEVRGTIEMKGENTVKVSGLTGMQATDYTVDVDGMDHFVYTNDTKKTYNYSLSHLSFSVIKNQDDGYFSSERGAFELSGNLTFTRLETFGDGGDMNGLWAKGVSGELEGKVFPGGQLTLINSRITFQNGTIDTGVTFQDHLTIYGKQKLNMTVHLGNNGYIILPQRALDGQPLDGQLKIMSFSGTVVDAGKIFYGNPTLTGKGITIRTLQDPESGGYNHGWSSPPQYWKIEVECASGHIDGPSYPFWRDGGFIGVVVFVVLNMIGGMTYVTRKKK